MIIVDSSRQIPVEYCTVQSRKPNPVSLLKVSYIHQNKPNGVDKIFLIMFEASTIFSVGSLNRVIFFLLKNNVTMVKAAVFYSRWLEPS
jgi:hypothetical protein